MTTYILDLDKPTGHFEVSVWPELAEHAARMERGEYPELPKATDW